MYNSNISDNDDDLFAPKQSENTSTSSKTSSSFSPNIDSLTKELEDLFQEGKSSFFNQLNVKSKFVAFLNHTSHTFLLNISSGQRTIFNALNHMTGGVFGKNYYADYLEEIIARSILIHNFLFVISSADKNEYSRVLDLLSKKMKIDFDADFIQMHIIPFVEILDYKIEYNISIYTTLCSQLDRTPLDCLVSRTISGIDSSLLDYDHYALKYFASIRSEIGMEY